MFKRKENIPAGVIDIGETDLDFLASDIDLEKIENLPTQDRVYVEVDQDYGDYKQACTMMSSYSVVLSLWNMEEKEEEKKAILKKAVERGYKIGHGWLTQLGVDTVRKVWNELHPDKKVLYIRTNLGDGDFWTLIKKGYGGVFSRKLDWGYYKDKKDGCVEKIYKGERRGHAIGGYKGSKCGDILFVNTYPRKRNNRYEVKNIEKQEIFGKSVYFFIKEKDRNKDEILKKKIIEVILTLNDKLLTMDLQEKSREIIMKYNNYFKSVGFKPLKIKSL